MKKILIKAPNSDEQVLATFPLIHKLREEFPEAEINIILNSQLFNFYLVLPFKVKVFHIPEEKQTLTGVHKFSYQLKEVFNLDLYLNLDGTFQSNLMGRSFKAASRIGLKDGVKSLFLTHKVESSAVNGSDRYYLSFLESFLDTYYDTFKVIRNRTLVPKPDNFFKAEDNEFYNLVCLAGVPERAPFYQKFINSFSASNFVLRPEQGKDYTDFCANIDQEENKLRIESDLSMQHLVKLLIDSQGVITDINWIANLATYLGVNTVLITESNLIKSRHFKVSPIMVGLNADDTVNFTYGADDIKQASLDRLVDTVGAIFKPPV